MKTKMKKYQDGGAKKVTTVSNSGNYKTTTKNNTEPYGNKSGSATKVRRTIKGVVSGAPTVKEAKEARANDRNEVTGNSYPTYYHSGMGDFKKKGGTVKKMKTGGMVNANANLKATATAGSKGVMSGVNPKAVASTTAKKPSKPRSKAPKKAAPTKN
jgi:hypothetical protein